MAMGDLEIILSEEIEHRGIKRYAIDHGLTI